MAQNNPNDPFAAIGGGVQLPGGQWVPKNHPLAQQAQPQMATEPNGGYQAAGPQLPSGFQNINQQAQNAATYSNTPGANPLPYNTNQGTQDTVRNSYLQRATQGTQIDRNDPNLRQQADAFAAGQDRSQRQYLAQTAERMAAKGLGSSGAMDLERRMAAEKAGFNNAQFEAQLVGRELENRRSEIKEALAGLQGMLTADQEAQLRRDLGDLDAELKRLGITTQASTAASDIASREKVGMAGVNAEIMRALLANQQFNKGAALDWARFDWDTNPMNPRNW